MAKPGTLAGLAALGTAAYLMSQGKNKDEPKGKEDTGPGYKSTETRLKSPAQSIADADKSNKSSSISTNGAAGITTPGPDTSKPNLDQNQNQPPKPPKVGQPDPDANVSSTPPAPIVRSMQDDTKQNVLNALNKQAGANTPSALRSDQLAGLSRAVKREQKTKQFAEDVPYQQSASKTDAMMVASRAAKAADAKRRAAKQSSFKSGGAVKKMASGGMTASKRADGIASRGKTRCKMY